MSNDPAYESTEWYLAQVYWLCWPILLWNLARFEAYCDAVRETYGKGTLVVYYVHWWGWIEIGKILKKDPPKPDWLVNAETTVARLLQPITGGFEAFAEAEGRSALPLFTDPVSPGLTRGLPRPLPAIQDSS
ncbi:MAG: hypothetical protein AAF638_07120 [Pseudomonadota bacterium]